MNNTSKNSMCVVATALMTVATSLAGTATTPKTVPAESSSLGITGNFGVDVSSGQVYRGVVLDGDTTIQPHLGVSVPIVDNVSLKLNTTETIGTRSPITGFTRSENEIGVAVKVGALTVTPSFQTVYSPNSKYKSSEGINVGVKYDDSKLLGVYALNPHASVFTTTNGSNGNGTGGGRYYEVGVAPSTKLMGNTVSLPVNVGYGANNYYKGDASHGYTSVGLAADRALTDRVSLKLGVTYFNTAAGVNDKNTTWITTGGVAVTF